MSLRDELAAIIDNGVAECRPWEQALTELYAKVERALAAERAATVEECESLAAEYGHDLDALRQKFAALPRDRSALEDATKMAAAQARHEINQKIGEWLGQDADAKSLLQMLDDALAQAREAGERAGIFDTLDNVELE